jgi:hypothetical protein
MHIGVCHNSLFRPPRRPLLVCKLRVICFTVFLCFISGINTLRAWRPDLYL